MSRNNSKTIAYVAVMAALGNVLSYLSIQLSPIAPNIPLGPVSVSLAFDFSHLATFIAAVFGGPLVGGATGLISGLIAAFEFGFSKGNIVTGIALPIGKAMTGLAAGFIAAHVNVEARRILCLALTALSYVPEGAFTLFVFMQILPAATGLPAALGAAIGVQIVVKAFIEMAVMAVILAWLLGNRAFLGYSRSFFPK